MITDQPFTEATYSLVNKTLGDILRAKQLIEKIERCGVEIQPIKDYFAASEFKFNQFKREFFNDRP